LKLRQNLSSLDILANFCYSARCFHWTAN